MHRRPPEMIGIPAADGAAIRGDLYLPGDRPCAGLVVLCHGFKGYKTWGFFPYLAGRLCENGFAAVAMDFSFNGTFPAAGSAAAPNGRARYPRPDLFRNNTLDREVNDLASTLRLFDRNGFGGRIDRDLPVGLFGHSRGCVSTMVNAIERSAVRALSTWSTPDHPDRFTARQKTLWRRHGEYDFSDAMDGTNLSLSIGYLDDLEQNHDRYDLLRRAAELRVPHLVVHGEMDLVVPADRARALHEAARGRCETKLLILRTGHTFGVTDPPGVDPEAPPRALVDACDATVDWFETHLMKGI